MHVPPLLYNGRSGAEGSKRQLATMWSTSLFTRKWNILTVLEAQSADQNPWEHSWACNLHQIVLQAPTHTPLLFKKWLQEITICFWTKHLLVGNDYDLRSLWNLINSIWMRHEFFSSCHCWNFGGKNDFKRPTFQIMATESLPLSLALHMF